MHPFTTSTQAISRSVSSEELAYLTQILIASPLRDQLLLKVSQLLILPCLTILLRLARAALLEKPRLAI